MQISMLDFEAGSQNSLQSIIREEIPMLSLRLCFMYVQNFFIPECGSSSFGVTIF